jgi:hypothetical protein
MGLVDRLYHTTQDPAVGGKIGVHAFMAAMGELERGEVTRAQIVTAFNLSAEDETELDALISAGQAMPAAERFKFSQALHDVLLLGEAGYHYTTKAELRTRFGI